MNLQFHLEAFDDSYFYVDKKVDHVSSPPTFLLPLPFLNDNTKKKKSNRNKSQKVFWRKTSACRDGSLKNQPN